MKKILPIIFLFTTGFDIIDPVIAKCSPSIVQSFEMTDNLLTSNDFTRNYKLLPNNKYVKIIQGRLFDKNCIPISDAKILLADDANGRAAIAYSNNLGQFNFIIKDISIYKKFHFAIEYGKHKKANVAVETATMLSIGENIYHTDISLDVNNLKTRY